MRIFILAMVVGFLHIQTASANYFCRPNDPNLSLQHRELCQLKTVARRLQNGVRRLPWLYAYREGKTIRCLTKKYNQHVKKLESCASFTLENTHQDRISECSEYMDSVWKMLYIVSDYFEWNANILSDDKFFIMLHNRYSIGRLRTYTNHTWEDGRSWNDWWKHPPAEQEAICEDEEE